MTPGVSTCGDPTLDEGPSRRACRLLQPADQRRTILLPQSPEGFSRGVEEDLAELYGFHRPEALTSEKLIVAEEGGSVVGFVDYGLHERSESEGTKRVGVIRFLAYEPGMRTVGRPS